MSKLIKLTEAEIDLVMQADDYFGAYSYSSSSQRWYTIARNRGERHNNDIMVILCGVRNVGNHAECRPIGITSVDAKKYHLTSECDIYVSNGFFSNKRIRLYFDEGCPALKEKYRGKVVWWDYEVTDHKLDFVWKRPLNIGAVLAENPRFRYCALPKWGTHTMVWLRDFAICPEIENFSKMGVPYLASPKFVNMLKGDREFFRYFRSNLADIRKRGYSPTKIHYGYTHGITPSAAAAKFAFDGEVRRTRKQVVGEEWQMDRLTDLPKQFNWHELTRYLKRTRISAWEYKRYARYCIVGGADMTDPNTAFPHNLERRLRAFDVNKRKMELKECDDKLASLANEYEKLLKGMKMDGYIVIVPSASEHFVREGKKMGNCIGGGNYALNMAAGTCVCVFIRRATEPDTPFVDCEISKDGKVRQCYGRRNRNADNETRAFADRVARRLFKNNKRKAA